MVAGSAGREAGRRALSGLWGFSQPRLWRKERSEGKDKSKSLRFFGDALYFLKVISMLNYETPRAKGFRLVFFWSKTLSSWADGINPLQLYFYF